MSNDLDYDEEASRRLEAMYTTSDVMGQRQAVIDGLQLRQGDSVLDVGSGPGFLVSEMASVVSPPGRVCGVDISESMVKMSQSRCSQFSWVTLRVGDGHNLEFAEAEFDVVVSTQVLEYVADPVKVLAEIYRVVRPGGRVGILATDWASMVWHNSDQELMDRIVSAWSEHCTDPHLPRTHGPKLRQVGLTVTDQIIISMFNPETDQNTYSGGLIDLIKKFVVGRQNITSEEVGTWARGLRTLGSESQYFFSLNRYFFLAQRPV